MANNIFIEFLPPWIETGIQPAFYDKESGTVLQQTARMYAKVNEVVQSVNNQNETIADYIEKFNQLHDYVYDYFANLDVQQEINNKLDNMTQDGTLTTLIGAYVDPIQEEFENEINETLENKFTEQDNRISTTERMVASAVEGTPLPASSIAEMTDTDRIYVNTTDGKWYYYNGTEWVAGGTYEASVLSDESVDVENLVSPMQEQLEQIQIANDDIVEYSNGNYVNVTNGTGTSRLNPASSYSVYGPFDLFKNDIVSFTAQGERNTISMLSLDNGSTQSNVKNFWSILSSVDNTVRQYKTKVNFTGKYYITSKNAVGVTDLKIYRLNKSFKNDDIENIKDYITNIIIDNSNPSNFERGHYIRYGNGAVVNGTSMYITDYIPINGNTKITLTSDIPSWLVGAQNPDIAGYAFYDETQTYISGIQRPVGVQKLEMDVPTSARYIRLTLIESQIINGFKLYYSDLTGDIAKIKDMVTTDNATINRTCGVINNAVFIGDSLTYGLCYTASQSMYRNFYNYPYFVKKIMDINTIEEYARSGATSTSWWNEFADSITATNSVYFVWLGTNDNFTDTIATDCAGEDYTQYANTETGNMGKILQKIRSLEGNKIILLNCVHSGNHLAQTNEMIEKFAERFDVDLVIDLNGSDARNLKYHTAYNGFVNSVHYNDKGNNYIANIINQQFNEWLNNNQFEMIKRYS